LYNIKRGCNIREGNSAIDFYEAKLLKILGVAGLFYGSLLPARLANDMEVALSRGSENNVAEQQSPSPRYAQHNSWDQQVSLLPNLHQEEAVTNASWTVVLVSEV